MPATRTARADRHRARQRISQVGLQLLTLNHPVDCGICDKAGECKLQDFHYQYNGSPSISVDPKVRATKFYPLSERIVLDNERCILCSRCVRFTHDLEIESARHQTARRCVAGAPDGRRIVRRDVYSDNVIDICPVGALLSRLVFYKSRVWYLKPTPSVCALPRVAATYRSGTASQNGSSTRLTRGTTSRSSASRRLKTARSTGRGSATSDAISGRSSSGHVQSRR